MRIIILFAFYAITGAISSDARKVCSKSDESRDSCIRERLREYFKDTRLKSNNEIDPIIVQNVQLQFTSPISLLKTLVVQNATIQGLSDLKIQKVWTSFGDNEEAKLVLVVLIPVLSSEGFYKGEGRFINSKGGPRGYFNNTMADITTTMKISTSRRFEQDKLSLEIKDIDIVQTVQRMYTVIEGLFPDGDLNQLVNDYVNQYWRVFYKEMFGESKKFWEFIYTRLFATALKSFSFNE